MDELDFKILKLLDKNCRISNTTIANKLNLTVRTVTKRIDKLVKDNIIKYFTLQFNYNRLNLRNYIGLMIPESGISRQELYCAIQEIPEIRSYWEHVDGSITINFVCRDAKHLEDLLNELADLNIKIINYNETRMHLFGTDDIPFSPIDWRIIYIILINSRMAQKNIASFLGVNTKTIMRRLQRMRENKLVQFTPAINFEAIKGMVTGVVSLETVGSSKKIYLEIKKDKEIKYWRNAGSVSPSIVLFLYGNNLTEIYDMYLKLQQRPDVKTHGLKFIVKNSENQSMIKDAILEKIQEFK
ncbi:MAG: winged helix-turn-helix transcriptional regulator [Candidatus Helarchaeota archaeon]